MIGVTEASLSRWNNGHSTPHRKHLEQLKILAESDNHAVRQTQFNPYATQAPSDIGILLGHVRQLTTQIEMLQFSMGEMNGRVDAKIGKMESDLVDVKKAIEGVQEHFFKKAGTAKPTMKVAGSAEEHSRLK